MKHLTALLLMFLLAGGAAFISSCSEDEDGGNTTVEITQADIDAIISALELGVTGDKYGADVSIPHDGSEKTSDETIRDVYHSGGDVKPGYIVTKRTHLKVDDAKGDLLVTFAMVKRENGFDDAGGNWEYIMMPFDPSVNYSQQPNGDLSKAAGRGNSQDMAMCFGCHAKGDGGDYLFVR